MPKSLLKHGTIFFLVVLVGVLSLAACTGVESRTDPATVHLASGKVQLVEFYSTV